VASSFHHFFGSFHCGSSSGHRAAAVHDHAVVQIHDEAGIDLAWGCSIIGDGGPCSATSVTFRDEVVQLFQELLDFGEPTLRCRSLRSSVASLSQVNKLAL